VTLHAYEWYLIHRLMLSQWQKLWCLVLWPGFKRGHWLATQVTWREHDSHQ